MGKYFGREPRYSREEIEHQAQQAIEARVSLGRPPAEDWRPLEDRLEQLDRALVARPLPEPAARPESQPLRISEVRVPAPAPLEPAERAGRRPVAARPRSE